MRAHKNTFYFLLLIGYSVILLYFYAIGLLFLGFGSLSDGHYLYINNGIFYFTYAGWHTYFWIAFLPFFVSSLVIPCSSFASMRMCTVSYLFALAFKSVKFLIHAISVSYGWMRLNGEIFGKVDSLLVTIFLAKGTNGIIQ